MMILAATCRDTREAFEREGMPIIVRVCLRRTCITRKLHNELRWACIRFPIRPHTECIQTREDG